MDYTTVHHVFEPYEEFRTMVRFDDYKPNADDLRREYRPAETILGVTDPEEAFRKAQGEVVNREQGGVHMVHSCMVTDVFEVHEDDDVQWFLVEPFGFTELDIDGEIETKRKPPHDHALSDESWSEKHSRFG